MKKILIAALTAAMGLCMACGMAACGEEPSGHVHTYSLGWSHNATHHWHALTCEDSATVSPESLAGDKNSGYGEHSFNESGVCSVCKYDPANPEGPAKPEHQHTYVWRYVVGQEPTCTESGIEEHVCSGCGEYSPEEPKQRTVGMLGITSATGTPAPVAARRSTSRRTTTVRAMSVRPAPSPSARRRTC